MASHHHHHHTKHQRGYQGAGTAAGDASGWVEGITALSEEAPATGLLAEQEAAIANGAFKAHAPAADGNGSIGGQLSAEQEWEAALEHALGLMEAEVDTVGEVVLEVGALSGWGPPCRSAEQRAAVMARLQEGAQRVKADVSVLRERTVEVAAPGDASGQCWLADVAVRRRAKVKPPIEVRVAVIGNVDSGKSTMVGVLTRSMLDDGRGLARSKVFKHSHEEATGRTSSIGQHNLCLDSQGHILNDTMFRNSSCGDYIMRASKVVTLVDLAGHEKYFRTTAYGLTGHLPDYACLIVGANMGVVGMCKEHLGVALALKVPVFFVITKIDICPEHILKSTVQNLTSILKKPGVRKKPFLVRTMDDVLLCARNINSDSLAPIFLTSAVTGRGLDLVRMFYSLMPQRQRWADVQHEAAEFIIDETFGVPGVGTVVAGTVKRGTISASSHLVLGPDIGDGSFKPAAVKSIHYKRLPVGQVVAGQTAALALKKVKRGQVRKGMVLVDERLHPKASWEFEADIAILTHSTTIQPRYQAVIHCEIIRQAARVVAMDRERLRSGDRACVRFRFLQRPEYVTPGARFVFREGRTKGIGIITASEHDHKPPPAATAAAAATGAPTAGAAADAAPVNGEGASADDAAAAQQGAPAGAVGTGAAGAGGAAIHGRRGAQQEGSGGSAAHAGGVGAGAGAGRRGAAGKQAAASS